MGWVCDTDDSHINGLFRELVEDEGKPLFYVTVSHQDDQQLRKQLQANLRLPVKLGTQLTPLNLDNPRSRMIGGTLWLEAIRQHS